MGLQGIGNRCLSLCSNAFSDEVWFHENPSRFNFVEWFSLVRSEILATKLDRDGSGGKAVGKFGE